MAYKDDGQQTPNCSDQPDDENTMQSYEAEK